MKLSLRYSLLVGAILGCAARCAATVSSEKEFTQLSEARGQLEEAVTLRTDAHHATVAADYKVENLRNILADSKRILRERLDMPNEPVYDSCGDCRTASKDLEVAELDAITVKVKETACQQAVGAAYRNVIAKNELIKEWAASIAGKEVVERYDLEKARKVGESVNSVVVQGKGSEADEVTEHEENKKKDKKHKKDKSEKKKSGKARLSSDEDKAADHEGETKDPKDLADASTVAPPVIKEETGQDTVAPVIKEETGESALEQKVEKDNSLDNVVADQDSMASFNKPTLVGILSLVSVALFY